MNDRYSGIGRPIHPEGILSRPGAQGQGHLARCLAASPVPTGCRALLSALDGVPDVLDDVGRGRAV